MSKVKIWVSVVSLLSCVLIFFPNVQAADTDKLYLAEAKKEVRMISPKSAFSCLYRAES